MESWFPDNSVLVSFASVDKLPLLRASLRGRGRAVEAVVKEIKDSASRVPNLAKLDLVEWFGEPITITEIADVSAVESMRVHRFGGSPAKPREHLGESQTLHVIRTHAEYRGSIWITEDRDAFLFAKKQGIIAHDIFDQLRELVAFGEITAEEAYEIARAMDGADRPLLRHPNSHKDFR